MKLIQYTEEQVNKIASWIKLVEVKGDSVMNLAAVIQELNQGKVIEQEEMWVMSNGTKESRL